MQFLNDYMNASERENAIFEAQMNRESIVLDNKWNSLIQEHALRLADIDLSVVLERYSDDDTQALFEREMAIYMEGVKEWWAEFKKWFSGLINKICGKPSSAESAGMDKAKDSNDDVELPCNPDEAISTVKRFTDIVKNHMKYKKPDGSWDKAKIAADAAGVSIFGALVGGGGVAIANLVKKTKIKASDIEPKKKDGDAALGELNKAIQALPETSAPTSAPEGENKEGANADNNAGGENIIKVYANKIISFFRQYFLDPIKAFFTKLGKGTVDDEKAADNTDTNTTPEGENKEGAATDNKAGGEPHAKTSKTNRIIQLANSWKIATKGKGDKVTIDELEDYVNKIEAHAKKNANKKVLGEIDGFREAIKEFKEKNINEFTIEDDIAGALPVFEAMAPIDDAIIDRELMLMTESEEADVAEFIDLVDSL